jgi:FdhE protein
MSGQTPPAGDLNIGKAAAEEFVRPPRPLSIFEVRARRMAALAEDHPAGGFLRLMQAVFAAQAEAAASVADVQAPSPEALALAAEHGMPLLSRDGWRPSQTYRDTLRFIAGKIGRDGLPEAAAEVLGLLGKATDEHLDSLARAYLTEGVPPHWQGEATFAIAALQVEFARYAALLDKDAIKPLDAKGLCPVCGSPPVAGVIVADDAHGRRYLTCGLCSTSWHHLRVACISCGAEKGVAYQEIEGGDGSAKAETCDECKTYSKLFYQTKNMAVEALCDDLATVALDILVQEAGWKRHAPNPFLPVI